MKMHRTVPDFLTVVRNCTLRMSRESGVITLAVVCNLSCPLALAGEWKTITMSMPQTNYIGISGVCDLCVQQCFLKLLRWFQYKRFVVFCAKLKSTNLENEGALNCHLSPQSNLYYFSKEPSSRICAKKEIVHDQIILRNSVLLLGGS